MAKPIRVLIADDHPNSRKGLRALLTTSPEVEVVGEAVDGAEAVRLVEQCRPNVVLMDARMPGMDGLEATRQLKRAYPALKVVMLSMYAGGLAEALAAGADIFLMKGCPVEQLWNALSPYNICRIPV